MVARADGWWKTVVINVILNSHRLPMLYDYKSIPHSFYQFFEVTIVQYTPRCVIKHTYFKTGVFVNE